MLDDHPGVLLAATRYLMRRGIDVVAATATAAAAFAAVHEHAPDVVVADLLVPGVTAGGLVAGLREASPASRPLAYTGFSSQLEVFSALAAGARGALLKGASLVMLHEAVRVVADHRAFLDPAVAAVLLDAADGSHRLTTEERTVIGRLVHGAGPDEVAEEHDVTESELAAIIEVACDRLAGSPHTAPAGAALRGLLL